MHNHFSSFFLDFFLHIFILTSSVTYSKQNSNPNSMSSRRKIQTSYYHSIRNPNIFFVYFLISCVQSQIYGYLRSLESQESDRDLLLRYLRNLGHSFFLFVSSLLPVAQFVTISTLIVRLRTFTLLRFARYLHPKSPTLKLHSFLIFHRLISIIPDSKILSIIHKRTMKA